MRVCLITSAAYGRYEGGILQVTRFIKTLEPLCDGISIIPGRFNEGSKRVRNLEYHVDNLLLLAFRRLYMELLAGFSILKVAKDTDVIIFRGIYVFPMLIAKLLRKKTIFMMFASPSGTFKRSRKNYKFGYIGAALPVLMRVFQKIDCFLSDQIFLESKSLIQQNKLGNYEHKIWADSTTYVDPEFRIVKGINERKNAIGYLGRLSEEKGIMCLVSAIPMVLKTDESIRFLICGGGPLYKDIQAKTENYQSGKVELVGLISHDKVSHYLNELKLLIIPSYTEGLTQVVLEAMACGTPVLATPVGGIPDVIEDGKTGFIMEDNSPECIARNTLRALNHPKLEKITKNARTLIDKKYTYEAVVEKYRNVLAKL